MATASTSTVYAQVIEDVINNIRDEFINSGGPGEGVLSELQGLWELKMMQAGAILGPIDRSSMKPTTPGVPTNPLHDLNVPYEGPEEYETPTADLLFPPTPMQTPFPAQTPLPGTTLTPLPGSFDSSYNLPSPWLNQRPTLDVNAAYVEVCEEFERGVTNQPTTQDFFHLSSGKRKREDFSSQYFTNGYIPQQDGSGDLITDNSMIYNFQGVLNEDYNIANTPAPPEIQAQTPFVVNQNDVIDDDEEEEPLNENDDDDVDQGDEVNTYHLILAQFDKVTRAKNRWKCSLKDGIMHINNKDVLFNKVTGEFDF